MNKTELSEKLYDDASQRRDSVDSIVSIDSRCDFVPENNILCTKNYKKLLMLVTIFGLVLGWSIISIISLFVNPRHEIEEDCPGNMLWEYLVIMLVVNNLMVYYIIYRTYKNHYNDTYCKFSEICVCIFIQLIIISSGVIFLHNSCVEVKLKHSFIYTAIASWLLWQGFIVMLAVCITIITTCFCSVGGA